MSFQQGAFVGICENCGSQQTLPRINDDRRANLYDRAGHLRRNNEYDKAMSIYEQLLNEDKTDAEAYWSIVLCKYGIEYVEDPATHKHVPTVNRTQYTSIFADENYKMAVMYADSIQRSIYEADAKTIDLIQKDILAISLKEEPFDVFLCYKETDGQGRRTVDSVLANDIYSQLVREGYKVFYSRITLENVLGTAYEPHIFAALNSANVMIVIGTKAEYFNAPWVKNEWSRFLALVSLNHEKVLIPAYRDMDPYGMPQEFSHLQALDMGRIGFIQDVLSVVRKKTKKKGDLKTGGGEDQSIQGGYVNKHDEISAASETALKVNNLLKRAEIFLEDGDFDRADDYYDRVLLEDSHNAKAYYGKLLISANARTQRELINSGVLLSQNEWYKKAIEYGTPDMISILRECRNEIDRRIENERKDGVLRTVISGIKKVLFVVENGGTQAEEQSALVWAQDAREKLAQLGNYKNAKILTATCDRAIILLQERKYEDVYISAKQLMNEKTVSAFERASQLFGTIIQWKDSSQWQIICNREAKELPLRKKRQALIYAGVTMLVLLIITIVLAVTFKGNKGPFLIGMLIFDVAFLATKCIEMRMRHVDQSGMSYDGLRDLRAITRGIAILVGGVSLFLYFAAFAMK